MNRQVSKFKLYCEECTAEAYELEIQKNKMLVCKDCAEAKERRDRFKREEAEWNRGVGQKETE